MSLYFNTGYIYTVIIITVAVLNSSLLLFPQNLYKESWEKEKATGYLLPPDTVQICHAKRSSDVQSEVIIFLIRKASAWKPGNVKGLANSTTDVQSFPLGVTSSQLFMTREVHCPPNNSAIFAIMGFTDTSAERSDIPFHLCFLQKQPFQNQLRWTSIFNKC